MTLTAILAYTFALLVAVATPGPAMMMVISTGIGRGFRAAAIAGAGVALADLILVGVALAGLAALMSHAGWLFAIVKYAGAAYLVWIGIRMWRASPVPKRARDAVGDARGAALLGLGVGLSNPKAILFHASLMPLILDLAALTLADAALVLGLVLVLNLAIMTFYAALAAGAARWFGTPGRVRWMNRLAGGAMAGTGVAVAVR